MAIVLLKLEARKGKKKNINRQSRRYRYVRNRVKEVSEVSVGREG